MPNHCYGSWHVLTLIGKNYYSQGGYWSAGVLINQMSDKSKSWMMSEGIVGKGLGWVGSKETDALIFSSPWKCFAEKKEKKETRHLSLSPHAFISFCLILNFHYSPKKAKPSLFTLLSDMAAPLTHTLTYIHFNQTPLLIIPIGFFHLPAICCLITKIISRGGAEGPLPWRPNGKGQGEFILSAIENGY